MNYRSVYLVLKRCGSPADKHNNNLEFLNLIAGTSLSYQRSHPIPNITTFPTLPPHYPMSRDNAPPAPMVSDSPGTLPSPLIPISSPHLHKNPYTPCKTPPSPPQNQRCRRDNILPKGHRPRRTEDRTRSHANKQNQIPTMIFFFSV